MKILFAVFSSIFGCVIGSFMNVLIFRIPRKLSIVKPNSFCPRCKKPIPWYENIPVISYIMLGGQCSQCHAPISIQYPLIEIITGGVFLYSFLKFGFSYDFVFHVLFFFVLIVISGIDLTHQLIPDIFSFPGIALGLIYHLMNGTILNSVAGLVFGGGLILVIRIIGGKVYKKEVMGMGDVYLCAMIGAFVGFPYIIAAIFLGALSGAVLGIIYIVSTRQDRESAIPFGPFLSIGGISVILFKHLIIQFFATLGIYIQ
jgi:leader peptidase (prepilin peptidase)/N-methyltransferase